MSLLKRMLGWPSDDAVSIKHPERPTAGALRENAVRMAAKDGIAVIDNPLVIHEGVNLERRRVTDAKRFREPQTRSHGIVFGGSTTQDAVVFIEALAKVIERGEPRKRDAHWVLHEDLNELAKKHYPGKIFQLSNDRKHELCDEKTLEFQRRDYHEKAVRHAQKSGMTLEFCYRKPARNGGKTFNIKRVLVTAIHEDWFRGVDSRGPRNYRFDRMFGSALDKGQIGIPAAEPYVQLLLLHGFFGQGVFMTFGRLGEREDLLKPEEQTAKKKR